MRTAFIDALFDIARQDPRIVLIVGDLGYGVVTRFHNELPDQFVNAGVAEQNMTGLAAGMAMSGKIAFTYSIANFPVLRCFEQIRNDACYHHANVKIVAVGGGFAYGALGASHFATEDIAVMRTLPGMTVVAPNDPLEAGLATRAIAQHDGPCYLRLGRAGEPIVHTGDIDFTLGKSIQVRDGRDVTLVATGGLLGHALKVADRLALHGITTRVISMHTIKPLDIAAIVRAARETAAMFTLEEHTTVGGLGGAVAEAVLEADAPPRTFRCIGTRDRYSSVVGDQDYLRKAHGVDVEGIYQEVTRVLGVASVAERVHSQ